MHQRKLLTLIIDILIYIKSIGHCLSPQKISLLYVLYLQRYGVLDIAQNKTAANFTQNVTHIMHNKIAISQKLLGPQRSNFGSVH